MHDVGCGALQRAQAHYNAQEYYYTQEQRREGRNNADAVAFNTLPITRDQQHVTYNIVMTGFWRTVFLYETHQMGPVATGSALCC